MCFYYIFPIQQVKSSVFIWCNVVIGRATGHSAENTEFLLVPVYYICPLMACRLYCWCIEMWQERELSWLIAFCLISFCGAFCRFILFLGLSAPQSLSGVSVCVCVHTMKLWFRAGPVVTLAHRRPADRQFRLQQFCPRAKIWAPLRALIKIPCFLLPPSAH